LTLLEVITSTVISFLEDQDVLVLIVKVPMVAFPLPQLFALLAEAASTRPSTRVVPEENEFKDVFTNLIFG
jgi:hypothetical protein